MSSSIKLSSPATQEFWEIPVLFEDDQLLALDKPPGLLATPDRTALEKPSLIKLLHAGIAAGKPWARERGLTYLVNAHRLDADTSGVLLLAKTKSALVALANQFGAGQPIRQYVALVQGVPLAAPFVVDEKIAPHPVKAGQMRIDRRDGKKASTECVAIETFSRWALVRCIPQMERSQQVLLHLSHAGFPVVGDEMHGGKKLWLSRLKRDYHLKPGREERPLLSRPTLHAEGLEIQHPVTQQPVAIKSDWPKDLRVAVKYLRLYAKGDGHLAAK